MKEQLKDGVWRRPFTSKRYLHPPFSGYLCTQWCDCKVLFGQYETTSLVTTFSSLHPASGFRVLFGAELSPPDFRMTYTVPREDGVPIHSLQHPFPNYSMEMESFCTTNTEYPTVFTRITLYNKNQQSIHDQIGLMVRSGAENHLSGHEVDGYSHFDGNVGNWGFLPETWQFDGVSKLTDNLLHYKIEIEDAKGFSLQWQGVQPGIPWHKRGVLIASFTLQPGESLHIDLRMNPPTVKTPPVGYEIQRRMAKQFWQKELDRIRSYPGQPVHRPVVRNLTVQMLQMFATYLDDGYRALRQGGMNRHIWTVEAMEVLIALEQMGGFSQYTHQIFDYYFNQCQIQDGKNKGEVKVHIPWASTTAGAVRACAFSLLCGNEQDYKRYCAPLYAAFQWMERQRLSTKTMDVAGKGLFPPGQGTDWPGEYQNWCMTDSHNLMAYSMLADAFEQYGDVHTAEIQDAYIDYMACARKILKEQVAKYENNNELLLENSLGCPQTDPPKGAYFIDGPAALLLAGVMEPCGREVKLVENWFRNRACFQNGLTGLMNDGLLRCNKPLDYWAGHTWYTSWSDTCWMQVYLAQGRYEEAEEILEANLRYGMSEAYYLAERYADNDPYWTPWQPNASASGRMLQNLRLIYGTSN